MGGSRSIFLPSGWRASFRGNTARRCIRRQGCPKACFHHERAGIFAELPKLKPEEFRLVKAKVDDLARAQRRTIGDALPEVAGTAEG